MKKLVLAVSALALSAVSASAADLAARPYTKAPMMATVYDWSGFYVGVNGGYGYTHDAFNDVLLPGGSDGSSGHGGGVYGGQFGYRVQLGQIVYGFDMQGDGASIHNTFTGSSTGALLSVSPKAFGAFTGTLGYAVNNVLLYAKGGAGFASNTESATIGVLGGGTNEARWGGVLGAGLEYGFTPSWSAAFEYEHLFLQNATPGASVIGGYPGGYTITQSVDLFTARLNYHFSWGGPVVARY